MHAPCPLSSRERAWDPRERLGTKAEHYSLHRKGTVLRRRVLGVWRGRATGMRVSLIFLLFPKLPLPVSPCLSLFCFLDLKTPEFCLLPFCPSRSLIACDPAPPFCPQGRASHPPPQCPVAVGTIASIVPEEPCEPGCPPVSGGKPTCPEARRIIRVVT